MSSIITIHEQSPSGGAHPSVGKTPILALRMLIKNDLDHDWRIDTLDVTETKVLLSLTTDDCRRVRRTVYIGPLDGMRLLLGVIGWYKAHASDPSTRSQKSSELLAAIEANLTRPHELERLHAEWRERFNEHVMLKK
jgi:hypothetical protein